MSSTTHVMPWSLLLLLPFLTVNGVQEHRNIEADGHVSVDASLHEHVTIESGGVMRREEVTDHPAMPSPKVVKHKSGHKHQRLHFDLAANATGQLMQMRTPSLDMLDSGLKCNTPIFAPEDKCPFECPYLAEDSSKICHFRCLAQDACGSLDPLAKIADEEDMICRRCTVIGCKQCIPGGKDVCRICSPGYKLNDDGECDPPGAWALFAVKVILVSFLVLGILWILELMTRKRTNWTGFRHGAAFRWRTRIHMPLNTSAEEGVDDTDNLNEEVHEQLLYPMSTNLLRQPIGGPGLSLHMNFFMATLIWAGVIIYMYAAAATMISIDMLVIGLTPTKTSQQLCAVVHWGHDAQMRLIWAKTSFVVFAYIFTFAGCIYLARHQKRTFHRLDDDQTMKDYMAYASGLPNLKGSEDAEEELRMFFEEQTHQRVRGVSICWNYTSKDKEIMQTIEADWQEREKALVNSIPDESLNPTLRQPRLSFFRRQLRKFDCVFNFDPPRDPPAQEEGRRESAVDGAAPLLEQQMTSAVSVVQPGPSEGEIIEILNEMESSDVAFVIFDTEEGRNAAVENVDLKQGLDYKGSFVNLELKYCEPESARFSGLCYGSNKRHRVKKMIQGTLMTLFGLVLWATILYFPYAYYMISFSYAQGQEPPFFASQLFNVLVVGGNQLMFILADMISQRADFEFEDEREVAYNYVYLAACILNTILDLFVTIVLAYKMMLGMGVHTSDDQLVVNLVSFQDIFESYPMQKVFGDLLFDYAFPSCFFYPFFLEAVGTITLPYLICKYIVLSHDEVQERDAELSLQYFATMNLGRYADILLNMILCVMVFFSPGGFTLPMFMAFFVCHVGLYMFDHWRILRVTPNFYYANCAVDDFGQAQLMIPTAILAACAVFRFSQLENNWLDGTMVYVCCLMAFFGHCALHLMVLRTVVPMFEQPPHEASKVSYSEVAKIKPLTWFSANPVHCLRSKYLKKDNPPNIMCINGKEHLQKSNEKIGVYFEDKTYARALKIQRTMIAEERDAIAEDKEEQREENQLEEEEEADM